MKEFEKIEEEELETEKIHLNHINMKALDEEADIRHMKLNERINLKKSPY